MDGRPHALLAAINIRPHPLSLTPGKPPIVTSKNLKGRLLEDIVAAAYKIPRFKPDVRVYLPTVSGGRQREIDVLLTADIEGVPVRIPIECKNEAGKATPRHIDAFVGKLQDLGIPVSCGIYVTAGGYTSGALGRARDAGIQPLVLAEGLTVDRLAQVVNNALQSVVYLLCMWTDLSDFPFLPGSTGPTGAISTDLPALHYTQKGLYRIPVLDHVWNMWMAGTIPETAGEHTLFCQQGVGATVLNVQVVAHVASITGTATRTRLTDATTGETVRFHLQSRFEKPQEPLLLTTYYSETDLQKALKPTPGGHLITRIRVPRLRDRVSFWPPTREALERMLALKRAGNEVTFANVEGHNLAKALQLYLQGQPVAPDADAHHERS